MTVANYSRGDWVIYAKQKVSTAPGKRAHGVTPAQKGDTYSYVVDKFWIVDGFQEDGQLLLRTRRGKRHTVRSDDPRLRKASWWEKLLYASRFRPVQSSEVTTE